MNMEMLHQMQKGKGFIAALDQSGGSTPKALAGYGLNPDSYTSEDEMFDLIHQMRTRIITSKSFTDDHIIGAILFEKTMESKIGDKYTAEYLWEEKHIVPFLKIDDGLAERKHGVQIMKDIRNRGDRLTAAKSHGVFGTKMRSVIYEPDERGIQSVIDQQFSIAEHICEQGLVPIIEPEVNIMAADKEACERIMKDAIIEHLKSWSPKAKIMFKFTIPTIPDFYADLYQFESVLRIVALSGGYDVHEACELLSHNHNMPASFSRALLQDLRYNQSQEEFDSVLAAAINQIYAASIN